MEILNNTKNTNPESCCNGPQCGSANSTEVPYQTLHANNGEIITTFKVVNMDCADEIKAIKEALSMDGVLEISANLMASTVQILHRSDIEETLLKKRIETTIVKIASEDRDAKKILQTRTRVVALSGILLVSGLVFGWLKINPGYELIVYLLSIILAGSLVFPKAFQALKRKTLDMNVLMSLAAIGALLIKEYSEASAVVFLFALSELLESFSVQKARRAIEELLSITPQTASLVKDNGEIEIIPVEHAQINQILLVRSGEKVPTDAIVAKGESTVNQAPLTGESVPVLKHVGDMVFAGTINQDGGLEIKVTKEFQDSKISQVIRLVEEAQNQKATSQKFVDRFAHYYTPAVLVLAILTFIIPPFFLGASLEEWFYKALTLLVIACPCALVISTPVSIVSGLTYLAKQGILVKGGIVLEQLGKIQAIALDKTGTITKGTPTVQKIMRVNSYDDKTILQIAAALESHSSHPIAEAIKCHALSLEIENKNITNFKNFSGMGVEAIIDNHVYFLGNHKFAHNNNLCSPELEKMIESLEDEALSIVIVGHKPHSDCKGEIFGIIALGDEIKESSQSAIFDIRKLGIEKIVMLSGDNQKAASSIAQKVGIQHAIGNLLPENKLTSIEQMKKEYGVVSMIGDGINDAPAMAAASVSIAMGAAGSDAAIEVADIALMTDDLSLVAKAITAGRRVLSLIKFNIAFSLATKAIFLVLTYFGYTNLWAAVAADTGVSLLVILNSLRLLR